MTLDNIINEIKIHDDVAISFDIVKDIRKFQIATEARGMLATMTWMATKERIMQYNFNDQVFKTWCEDNGYDCMIDEYQRIVRIKNR